MDKEIMGDLLQITKRAELSITDTCSLLNISRRTFYRWLYCGVPDNSAYRINILQERLQSLLDNGSLPLSNINKADIIKALLIK